MKPPTGIVFDLVPTAFINDVPDPVFIAQPEADPVSLPEPVLYAQPEADPAFLELAAVPAPVPELAPDPEVNPVGQPGTRSRKVVVPDQNLIIQGPRNRTPVVRWIEESTRPHYASLAAVGVSEPSTLKEALASPQADQWKLAMEEEMKSLEQNETWTLTSLPKGRQTIQNRWVFKLKLDGDGAVRRYKARLVAKGFTQRPGIDFEETFSPVVKHDSLRAVLAVAAEKDLHMLQLDVKTAFLNGDLHEELYMAQPAGFVAAGREKEVCKLNRSLYGLKQASRAWNIKFHGFLTKFGFVRSSADPCVYIKEEEDCLTLIAIWVDDGLICSSKPKRLDSVVEYLSRNFEMTCEPVDCFLASRSPETDRTGLSIFHKRITSLVCWKSSICRSVRHARFQPTHSPVYRRILAGTPHLKKKSLLVHIVRLLGHLFTPSQFSSHPTRAHWEAGKRILSHLKGTLTHGITYGNKAASRGVLQAYSELISQPA